MRTKRVLYLAMFAAAVGALYMAASMGHLSAQAKGGAVKVGSNEIGGVVASSKGPEAGVWVIAETTDLPTRYMKIVVTDDRGRYLLPDLPKANYTVWARGYNLVDSPKAKSETGKTVNLKPGPTTDSRTAAMLSPASYWYSLLKVPEKNEFPGTGPQGNGINPSVKSQAEWIHLIKTDSCESCHQLGTPATRTISKDLGTFDSPALAWQRRIQSGQAGQMMLGGLTSLGVPKATALFGDWTTRVAGGELPPVPPRPQGVERNVVITQWDWADPKAYLHDEIATDKRNPTVNAFGKLYGSAEESRDYLPVLDPVKNVASQVKVPYRDPNTPGQPKPLKPSVFWGEEAIWDSHITVHNPMLDDKGRVWFTSRVGVGDNPAFCKAGSDHPSAKVFPLNNSGRHLAVYDPKTDQVSLIRTCFSTHHLQFAQDANYTLWTSSGGGGGAVGWLNTKMWDQTHDEEKSQGWTPLILDTNGNGKRDAYTEPDQPADPNKDRRVNAAFYGVTVSPADGSIWGTVLGFPGAVVRLVPGSDPAKTALAEYYELPLAQGGYSPRGLDIDTNGVVWVVLSSGHLASFDRRKCKGTLNGPDATGQQCQEGWALYASPGPNFKNVNESGSADSHYYDWVDQFDTFGLGRNVPVATGNGSDSLLALVNGKWVVLRVPYPMGFFAKGLDGRIDDSKAGWKGKGLWSTWATRTPFHSETGKGTQSKVVHFQLRPDPLAD
jgi:hypothetical protein